MLGLTRGIAISGSGEEAGRAGHHVLRHTIPSKGWQAAGALLTPLVASLVTKEHGIELKPYSWDRRLGTGEGDRVESGPSKKKNSA